MKKSENSNDVSITATSQDGTKVELNQSINSDDDILSVVDELEELALEEIESIEQEDDVNLSKHTKKESNIKKDHQHDLIQYYTAGKISSKNRQLVFTNYIGDSFFMKAEAFLDLLSNLGTTRLIKKYNKKKKGYIGGEVIGSVTLKDNTYKFLIGFGPQNQIVKQSTILYVHEYNIPKKRVNIYIDLLNAEFKEENEFLTLLAEADHNLNRRLTIDLSECVESKKQRSQKKPF